MIFFQVDLSYSSFPIVPHYTAPTKLAQCFNINAFLITYCGIYLPLLQDGKLHVYVWIWKFLANESGFEGWNIALSHMRYLQDIYFCKYIENKHKTKYYSLLRTLLNKNYLRYLLLKLDCDLTRTF